MRFVNKQLLLILAMLTFLTIGIASAYDYQSENYMDTGTVADYATEASNFNKGGYYSIILRDAELKESLRFLSRVANRNIMIPESVTGVVNIRFDHVQIMDAINSIIRANDLDYAIERGVLRVGKTNEFATTGEDLKTETIRLRYATAKDLVDKVKSLLTERGSALSDDRTNSLIIRERLGNIDSVKKFLKDVDVRDAQILIEAKIAEVTRDFSRNLGIQWGVNMDGNKANVVGLNAVGQSDSLRNLNVNLPATNPTSGLGLIVGSLGGNTNIDVQISAAEQTGDARVISEPRIITSNGVTAKIRSGETLLIKTTGDLNIGSSTSTVASGLHEIETGVELKVTPQISGDGLVKLKIEAITSQPDFSREVEGIPVVIDNTAYTEVLVYNGQTTVIGGLFKITGGDIVKAVPFFSQIPLLGNLFKSKITSKRNTELMIFIKPLIIRPLEEVVDFNAQAERVNTLKDNLIVPPLIKVKDNLGDDTRPIQFRPQSSNPHIQYRNARRSNDQ